MNWQDVLPPGVSLAHGPIQVPPRRLMPDEEFLVRRATHKRRLEFAAGRNYARAALAQQGLYDVVILAGARREPLWPADVVGSITHTDTYCAAVAASARDLTAIGIDAERDEPLDIDVAPLVCTAAERRWCGEAARNAPCPAKLIFSLKESLFKALYPLTRFNSPFHDVEMLIDVEQRTARPRPAASQDHGLAALLATVEAAFGYHCGHVLAAAWIRQSNADEARRQ